MRNIDLFLSFLSLKLAIIWKVAISTVQMCICCWISGAQGVTHIVCPFGPYGDPDDGQQYLRSLEKRCVTTAHLVSPQCCFMFNIAQAKYVMTMILMRRCYRCDRTQQRNQFLLFIGLIRILVFKTRNPMLAVVCFTEGEMNTIKSLWAAT